MEACLAPGLGLYVHIPYCKSICPYCDFNVYRARGKPPYAKLCRSMVNELRARAPAFVGPLGSIYFGGGTPSLAPVDILVSLIDGAKQTLGLSPHAEITLEADPGTVDEPALRALCRAGVNRLSIGWQSSHDVLLRKLGRSHSAQAGKDAVAMARRAGFHNISLDLIFAVPQQTVQQLQADLDALTALQPQHVSLYALTYHQGTPFARRLERGSLQKVAEELELAMMERIDSHLKAAGFDHYEVSNFARPGYRAKHNSLYWSYDNVLGLGPGAHSFLRMGAHQARRWANLKRPEDYMMQFHEARLPSQNASVVPEAGQRCVDFVETLTGEQMALEQMMTGLRLDGGVHLPTVRACLASDAQQATFDRQVAEVVRQNLATLQQQRLVPTPLGRRLCDTAAALFAF